MGATTVVLDPITTLSTAIVPVSFPCVHKLKAIDTENQLETPHIKEKQNIFGVCSWKKTKLVRNFYILFAILYAIHTFHPTENLSSAQYFHVLTV
jgi:hypothetical protein